MLNQSKICNFQFWFYGFTFVRFQSRKRIVNTSMRPFNVLQDWLTLEYSVANGGSVLNKIKIKLFNLG